MYTYDFVKSSITDEGVIVMLNQYARGIGENQRDTDKTILEKLYVKMELSASTAFWAGPNFMYQYHWIVYDREAGGDPPKISEIFSWPTDCQSSPSTYRVRKDMNTRFIVKKMWMSKLNSNGMTYAVHTSYGGSLCSSQKQPINKFIKGVNAVSNWKDTGGGAYGDLKDGAVYYIIVNDNSNRTTIFANVVGTISTYFRCY